MVHPSAFRRAFTAFIVTLIALPVAAEMTAARAAAAGPAFACTPGFYQVLSGQLNKLNPVTGVYTTIGPAYADNYNGMGWDTVDNYMYAIDTTAPNKGDVLQIASDGSVVNLGLPTGTYVASGYNNGDIDPTGHLILRASATTWYSINLATMVSTSLAISSGAANDWVYIANHMYGLNGSTLTNVDLGADTSSTSTVTLSGTDTGGAFTSGTYGAGWTDLPSELYFSDNNTGHIYRITGFSGASPTAAYVVTGQITSNNDGASCPNADSPFNGPVGNPDSYTLISGQPYSANAAAGVLANDTGTPPLTAGSPVGPSHGSLTLNADGSFTYTPTGTYSGPDSFTYVASDQYARTSSPTTVSLTVLPAPQDHTYTTALNTDVNQSAPGLLTGSSGSALTVISTSTPANGAVTFSANGAFDYTPNTNFSGTDTFTYTVEDAASQTASATVTVNVTPQTADDSYTATGTSTLIVNAPGVLGNDVGTGLTVTSSTAASDGTATVAPDGSFTYTANSGFSGDDTFTYTASSGSVSNTSTVTIDVLPTAADDTASVADGSSVAALAATGVLSNDDGSGLTATVVTTTSNGTLSLGTDGGYTYTPNAGFSGQDVATYKVTDSSSQTATATLTFTVTPVAANDSYTVAYGTTDTESAGTGVLANDLGSSLTVTSNTSPSHGVLSLNTDGSFTYTPTAGYAGPDSFSYTAIDSSSQTSTATVAFTDSPPPVPVAVDDSYSTTSSGTLTVLAAGGVLANDSGVGDTVTGNTTPSNGSLTINGDGSFTYTPTTGFSGSDTFDYTVTDGYSQSDSGTVTVAVAPVAAGDAYTTPFNTTLTVAAPGVLSNDSGTGLTAVLNVGPSHGGLTLNPDGSFIFVPTTGYTGTDSFTYHAVDSSSQSTSVVTVNLGIGVPPATTVSGTIGEDIDRDGASDTGLSGVTVKLMQGATVVATTTTDASGDYTFSGVAAGAYTVVVDTTTMSSVLSEEVDPDATLDNQTSVTVNGTPVAVGTFLYAGSQLGITTTSVPTTPGGTTTITFIVTNGGPSNTSSATVLVFTPPPGVTVDPADVPSNCTLANSGVLTCSVSTTTPGTAWTLTITVDVAASVAVGTLTGGTAAVGIAGGGGVTVAASGVLAIGISAAVTVPTTGAAMSASLGGLLWIFGGIAMAVAGRRRNRRRATQL